MMEASKISAPGIRCKKREAEFISDAREITRV
jgi:hypothetical protein